MKKITIAINKKIIPAAAAAFVALAAENSAAMNPTPMPLTEIEANAFDRHLEKYGMDVYYYNDLNYKGIGYLKYFRSVVGMNPSGEPYFETAIMSKEDLSIPYIGSMLLAPVYSGSGDPYATNEYAKHMRYYSSDSENDMVFAFDYQTKDLSIESAIVYPTEAEYDAIEFRMTRPSSSNTYGPLKDLVAGYFNDTGDDGTYFCVEGAVACQYDAPIIFANMIGIESGYVPLANLTLSKSQNFIIPVSYVVKYEANKFGTLDSYLTSGFGEVKQLAQSGSAKLDFYNRKIDLKAASTLYIRNEIPTVIWQKGDFDFTISLSGGIAPSGYASDEYWSAAQVTTTVTCKPKDSADKCPTNLRLSGFDLRIGGRKADKVIFSYTMSGDMKTTLGTTEFAVRGLSTLSN